MSGRVNIPSTISDPSYRYTMPRMVLKQESRLNGVKTNITNLQDVARALRVPCPALIKYLCVELGANQEQETIVKGLHTVEDMLKLVDKFIVKYVLCAKCKYPEVAFEIEGKKKGKEKLKGRCNACGFEKELDNLHQAGKTMIKEIPTFYSANPEFRGKTNPNQLPDQSAATGTAKPSAKGAVDKKADAVKRAQEIIEQGGEINALDAKQLSIDSEEIENAIKQLSQLVDETDPDCKEILQEVRQTQLILNITSEFKYYILFCALFQGKRNVVKLWPKYESCFLELVKADGDVGIKRLIQTIALYFVKFAQDKQKYIDTFMNALYEQSVFSVDFICGWHAGDIKSDKHCSLYDRKAEKAFRPLLDKFVEWLQTAGAEEDYGEEEAADEQPEEESKEPTESETEQQRQMRLIAEQKKAQEEALRKAREQAAEAVEESKEEGVTDATKIAVADEFDIDDI